MKERLPHSSESLYSVNQPLTIYYLLLRCPRLCLGSQIWSMLGGITGTCPFRDEGLTVQLLRVLLLRSPWGLLVLKGAALSKVTPLARVACIQMTGPWRYTALAPMPCWGQLWRFCCPSYWNPFRFCSGCHKNHTTAQQFPLPDPASFSSPSDVDPRAPLNNLPAH